jgi:pyruvate/2-oxoglutarate dehydrogenase complex dihydrolipoamide dehydrogenase (E3) component
VTVLEAARALGRDDPEMAAVVLGALRAEGVDIREETAVARIAADGAGLVVETTSGDRIAGSHLLVAVGRRASTEDLGLERAGIRSTPKGIAVDAGLRTSNRRVYAIGDAAGGLMFTHLAGYHAGLVVRSALFGLPAKAIAPIPWVTYTDPELAHVGQTEAEARRVHGARLEVLRWDFAENDRARTEGRTAGGIKVMVARGRPVGATIVGAQAGELIGLWSLAIARRLPISALASMLAPYPTLGEISKRAAGQYYVPRLFRNARVRRLVGLVRRLP